MKNAFVASVLLASAAPGLAALYASPDGTCGPNTSFTCKQSFFGGCCGSDGKCGSTAGVCGSGCQKGYGFCSSAKDKRWNFGLPSYVLPVTSSKSSSSSKASYSPSKSLNGTKGHNYVKPTSAAAYDYASTVTITSVASATTEPSYPWWWPFGKGVKSAGSAASSPTPAGPAQGGSTPAKPVVYSKYTTLTVTGTKTHTFTIKGSKSLSYETYASPTVCPIETVVTLSSVTKTKTHTVTTRGSTSLSYEPYVTNSLCTIERPVTTTTSYNSYTSVKASPNPWWNPAPAKSSSTPSYSYGYGGSSSGYTSSHSSGHSSSYSSVSYSSYSHAGSVSSSPSSVQVGPVFSSEGGSKTASPSFSFSHPSGSFSFSGSPTFSSEGGSRTASPSFSFSIPSESISVPVGPTLSSESGSSTVSPSFSFSHPSESFSFPGGPTFSSEGGSRTASPSFSFSHPSGSFSFPGGPTFSSESGSSTVSPSSSFSIPSESISVPVGPTVSSETSSSTLPSLSLSIPSESISVPVGPTVSSEASSSTSSIVSESTYSSTWSSTSSAESSESSSVPVGPTLSSEISSTTSAPEASSTSSDFSSSSSDVSLTSSAPESSSTSSDVGSSTSDVSTSSAPEASSTSSDVSSSTWSSNFPSSTSSAADSSSSSSDFPSSTSSDIASSTSSDVGSSTSSDIASSTSSDVGSSSSSDVASSTSSDVLSSTSSVAESSSTSSDVPSSTSSAPESSSTSSDVSSSTSSDVSSSTSSDITSSTSSDVSSSTSSDISSTTSSDVSSSTSSDVSSTTSSDFSSSTSSDVSSTTSSDSSTITSSTISSNSSTITSSSTFSTITSSATANSTITSSATANSTSSTISSSTTVSSCLTAPTLTASTLPNCTPCAGQGSGQFCGFDINTNWYENTPITCNVVFYEFDITNTTASPDGVERLVLLVNGQMPGPPITASWGDTVVVKVNNKLQNNGTSIHFHGVRQLNNNMNDGVPSITQCPIAPGSSMTYTWVAENYGTSWYHSHFAIQAWEGVLGPIIIDGPHSASFDTDLGAFQVQDWSHFTVDSRYDLAQNATPIPGAAPQPNGAPATYGGPVLLDNGLINGQNIWLGDDQNSTAIGARLTLPTFQPNTRYLLRFINSAIQSTFKLYLDGHTFTVISTDFVPIVPYQTDILNINIGQRYDVIVDTTGITPGSYFLRADNQDACAGTVQALDIRAIVNYAGFEGTTPTSTAYNYTGECVDEPVASLVPVVAINAGAADITEGTLEVVVKGNSVDLYKWYLSGTTFFSEYNEPTLLDIWENKTLPTFSGNLLIELPQPKQWVYVIVESAIPLPHPLHLHGHDFHILAEAPNTTYAAANPVLNLANPPRRDTALLPAAGFIVLAFETDNPGVWLMHCHIGWHTSMGFALQFVEIQDQIASSGALNNSCTLNSTCSDWDTYANANGIVVLDSGV